jgi:hypothetical integral membrane protein (TIGR02206 family)|tara:strand:+ start:1182 stop:1928 length:747 start_codon:yes stop_codon:yes gene_type:complete
MSEAIHAYLSKNTSFEMFGTSHVLGLLTSVLLIVFIPLLSVKHLSKNSQSVLGAAIGFIVMLNYPVWVVLEIIAGSFDMTLHLPVHLCRISNLLIPLVMVKRHFLSFEILFFWGLSGTLQGAITPDISADFPHFHYFRFWIAHNGLVLALVYAAVVYKMKPTINSLWKSFIALNVFLIFAIVVNLVLDSNYFWICGKPVTPTGEHVPSILDYMGPWPWYILSAEFVALFHFFLALTPFYFVGKQWKDK